METTPLPVKKIITLSLIFLFVFVARARELHVCQSCECASIRAALDDAQAGDKIILHEGVYREGNIVIEKAIELTAVGNVILDGEQRYEPITVRVNNVVIKNLQVQNSGASYSRDIAGIKGEWVQHCTIENCRVLNSNFGIYLTHAQHCTVRNNTVEGNAVSEFTSGNAVHLYNCREITVGNNRLSKHRDGIYLELSDKCLIERNYSALNIRYGLHFMFSDKAVYRKNVFTKNQAGVAVMYSKHITMLENEFSNNWGSASYGLLLKEIRHGEIAGNTFTENTTAIFAEQTGGMYIHHNMFSKNGWALKIDSDCSDNTFSENNFSANTFELGTNAKTNTNCYESNFWSSYGGYDLNRDGVGDVPHHPVSFFTCFVEHQPHAALLMRSLFFDVLNLVERVYPTITPATLKDEKPSMQTRK